MQHANEQITGCHKDLGAGATKDLTNVSDGLGTFNELPIMKPLKYKNFGSSISAKRSCLECIPNNEFRM